MHHKETVHSIVFHIKKDKKLTVDQYATPGFANEFLYSVDPDTKQNALGVLKQTLANAYNGKPAAISFDVFNNFFNCFIYDLQ